MRNFSTTNWSAIRVAGKGLADGADAALAKVCERYWYPLYSYARRTKYSPHAAADATQGFFLHLLESSLIAKADPNKGRFRTFLLEAFRRFLISEYRSACAKKRGSGVKVVSIDETYAESRFALEPKDEWSPDRLFERNWALSLLENTLALLRMEFEAVGRVHIFDGLEKLIIKHDAADDYRTVGLALQMSETAVKVSVHRARKRFREILRGLVASTVEEPLDVDAELRHLLSVLSKRT